MVTVDVLLARRSDQRPVDLVVSIVDASNLERNLYLVSQVLELGLPTVVVLNMADVAEARGLKLNIARLRQQLGVPIILMQANTGRGVADLKRAPGRAGRLDPGSPTTARFPGSFRTKSPAWAIGWPPTAPGRCRLIWSSGCCWIRAAISPRPCSTVRPTMSSTNWPRPARAWRRRAARCRRSKPRRVTPGLLEHCRAWSRARLASRHVAIGSIGF